MSVWEHAYTVAMRRAADAITLPVKGKLILHFALVVAQLGDVYQIQYPDGYQSLTQRIFSPLRLNLLGWIPGLHLRCLGITSLEEELLVYSLVPFAIVLVGCGVSWGRYRSVVPALPFIMRLTYLFYPAVSSKGFQTLGECRCFEQVDGSPLRCFLPVDYSECSGEHAQPDLLVLGSLAVALYGIGVPLLYAGLLFSCRAAIRREEETPLSTALAFLHSSLHPWALYWPLVDAARAILLTGFLALVYPGELFQLLCGLVCAVTFLVLQIWAAPYRTASNNFLAMMVNFSIVLNFVSSLGVQVNANYVAIRSMGLPADMYAPLLSVVLYVSAFAVFPLTLVSLLLALRQRITPSQLRAYLLDEDDGSLDEQPLPLVARFGEFSINATDVGRALNQPLLSDAERRLLHEALPSGDSSRFSADPAAMVFGQPREAALGVEHFMCVSSNTVRAGMSEGVAAIRREIEAAAVGGEQRAVDALECLEYVQFARAGSSDRTFPNSRHPRDCDESGLRADRRTTSGEGMMLADFVAHPHSREAQLEEAHVLALRLYTTWAFLLLNGPLRDLERHARGEAHPLPVTVAFLAEGIRRLRAVGAKQENAHRPVVLYRGLANRTVPPAFGREGGTELAPMSTTAELAVAARYSASRSCVLLRLNTKSFIERGADLSYLSAFPAESEVLFPVRWFAYALVRISFASSRLPCSCAHSP
jgi:hypothetical protein